MDVPQYDRNKYYRIMDRTQSNYANQLKRLSRAEKRSDFILIYYSLAIIIYSLSVKFYPGLFDSTWTTYSSLILSVIVLIYSIINSKAGYPERISKIQTSLNEIKRLKRDVGSLPKATQICGVNADCKNATTSGMAPPCSCESYQLDSAAPCTLSEACNSLKALKKEYDELSKNTEIRDDLDFYYTIVQLCKKYHLNPYTGAPTTPRKEADGGVDLTKDEEEEIETIIGEIQGYISENNPKAQFLHMLFLKIWHMALYLAPILIFALGIFLKFKPLSTFFSP